MWNFLKRRSTNDIKTSSPATKKKKSDENHSYICLKCGSQINRGGRESYIKRHWESKHKDISYMTMKFLDVETMVNHLQAYKVDDEGSIRCCQEDRVAWETYGEGEFLHFWKSLSSLPQIKQIAESELNLLPHDGVIVFRRLKNVIFDLFWKNKYNSLQDIFVDEKGNKIDALVNCQLISIERKASDSFRLNDLYNIQLEDGVQLQVQLDESKFSTRTRAFTVWLVKSCALHWMLLLVQVAVKP